MSDQPLSRAAVDRSPALYGRARQLSAVVRAAAAVEEYKAQFVLIEGESGYGKTALLREALSSLPGWPKHVATGDAYERALPYGVLNQLLARFDPSELSPVLAGGVDPTVPTLTAGAELLALVDANEGAAVIAIDDAQWMDEQSARALWFAGRRSLHDRLLILIAARPASTDFLAHVRRLVVDGERGVRLVVDGLSVDNVIDLAFARSNLRLPRPTAQRLVAATDGNALHIRAILEYVAATAEPMVDLERRLGDGVLPLAPGFDTLVRESMGRLTEPAQVVIHLVAVLDGRATVSLLSAAAAHLVAPIATEEAIDEAVRSGLIDAADSGGQLELRLHHDRVGAAALAALPLQRQQELHRAAAQVVGGDRGLRHRVRASTGPDDALANTLDREASAALRHYEVERAVRYWLWAASLSNSPSRWQERLVQAGLAAITTRHLDLLVRATPEFKNLPTGVERDLMLGSSACALGDMQAGRTLLLRAASSTPTSDRDRVMIAVANESLATMDFTLRRYDRVISACEAALAELAEVQSRPGILLDPIGGVDLVDLEGIILAWHIFARWRSGAGDDAVSTISAQLADAAPSGFEPCHAVMLVVRGAIRRHQGRHDEAIADLEHGVALADVMRPSIAPYGRIELALAQFRQGRWDEAATTAALAVALAEDLPGSASFGASHAIAALVPAARGERAVVEDALALARTAQPPIDATLLLLVEAVAARAAGDRSSVVRIAQRAIATEHPRAQIGHGWWEELLEEATRPVHPHRKQTVRDPLSVLSSREREVANLAAQGLTNREVAQRLFVSVKGVEYHMGNVLAKLHLTSRRGIRKLLDGGGVSPFEDTDAASTRDTP